MGEPDQSGRGGPTISEQTLLIRLLSIFPFHAAELVLKEYRERFISEMDASSVVSDFAYHSIISDGVRESIAKANGPRQRNSILHDYLLQTCTNDAMMTACDMITSVQGNPKMFALGKDMKRRLESGVCVCVWVGGCACASAFVWVWPTFVLTFQSLYNYDAVEAHCCINN